MAIIRSEKLSRRFGLRLHTSTMAGVAVHLVISGGKNAGAARESRVDLAHHGDHQIGKTLSPLWSPASHFHDGRCCSPPRDIRREKRRRCSGKSRRSGAPWRSSDRKNSLAALVSGFTLPRWQVLQSTS